MTAGQGASRLKDLARVASGVSLVINELILKSPAIGKLKAGDLVGSTSSTLNFVQRTVADLTGLTQGSLRRHPPSVSAWQPAAVPGSSSLQSELGEEGTQIRRGPDVPQPQELFRPSGSAVKDNPYLVKSSEAGAPLRNELYGTTCVSGRDNFSPVGEMGVGDGEKEPAVPASSRESPSAAEAGGQALEQVTRVLEEGYEEKRVRRPAVAEGGGGGHVDLADGAIGARQSQASSVKKRKSRERRVPSTPLGRVFGFAGLGAGLAWGSVQESAKRLWGGQGSTPSGQSLLSPFMTEQNAERIAVALCRMRGAALKVGQMLSIQDESLVPAPVLAALESVRQGADVMPQKQLNKVLDRELGPGWRKRLESFDDEPIAAASIGQVHRAVLKDGREVAMKVQYPGVADSIDSDIENVRLLLNYTNLIPEGLYLDQAMRVAKEELRRECDYECEAISQNRYRKLLEDEKGFHVPLVIDEFSTRGVLTTELVAGVAIDKVANMDQKIRNDVGTQLLSLTLRELFVFRFMQTDPNWGNFLYDESTKTINLIDFGAARDFPKQFVDDYLKMVLACADKDREQIIKMSIRLGFLTGKEDTVMLDAHTQAAYATGEPFSKPGAFDFHKSNLPKQISELGATMLRHRLTPPPDEAYSLHRKLSGAFLACVKLSATVPCREILLNAYTKDKPSELGEAEARTASA